MKDRFERVLPIGSVVLLNGADHRLMIIGYAKHLAGDDVTVYDYAGCLYPEGFMSPDTTAVFNHEDIDKVYALGFQNDVRFNFEEKLKVALDKVKPFTD